MLGVARRADRVRGKSYPIDAEVRGDAGHPELPVATLAGIERDLGLLVAPIPELSAGDGRSPPPWKLREVGHHRIVQYRALPIRAALRFRADEPERRVERCESRGTCERLG